MKRKNFDHILKERKRKLLPREQLIEQKIKSNWVILKDCFQPSHIAIEILSHIIKRKPVSSFFSDLVKKGKSYFK